MVVLCAGIIYVFLTSSVIESNSIFYSCKTSSHCTNGKNFTVKLFDTEIKQNDSVFHAPLTRKNCLNKFAQSSLFEAVVYSERFAFTVTCKLFKSLKGFLFPHNGFSTKMKDCCQRRKHISSTLICV